LQLRDVCGTGESVPWAYALAAVAAVDGVAELVADGGVEGASVLDGLIGEAIKGRVKSEE
jgi:hypothetical protein